eukprot:6232700-Karenia_brevis.AAC.1
MSQDAGHIFKLPMPEPVTCPRSPPRFTPKEKRKVAFLKGQLREEVRNAEALAQWTESLVLTPSTAPTAAERLAALRLRRGL